MDIPYSRNIMIKSQLAVILIGQKYGTVLCLLKKHKKYQ